MTRRTAPTFDDVNTLLRYDAETGCLHWRKRAPRGRQRSDLRAGSEIKRGGNAICRVVTIAGVQYREHHLIALLQTGAWPTARRGRKAAVKIARAPLVAAAAVSLPHDHLHEVSKVAITAAKPAHRGWLFGLGRRLSG